MLKEQIMPNMKDYTKISISKDLHELIKEICDTKGIKMYFLEDRAVKEYIEKHHPEYIKKFKEQA